MTFDLEKVDFNNVNNIEDKPLIPDPSLKVTMDEAFKVDADQHATDLNLSRNTGVPVDAIEGDRERVKREFDISNVDFTTLQKNYPVTSKHMGDFNRAAISQDDIDVLQVLEDSVNYMGSAFTGLGETSKERFAQAGNALLLEGLLKVPTRLEDFLPATGLREIDEAPGIEISETLTGFVDQNVQSTIEDLKQNDEKIKALTPEDLDLFQQGVRGGFDSLIQMVPAAVSGILTRNTKVPMTILGVQSYAGSLGGAVAEDLDIETARYKAGIDAAIEVITELGPTKTLVDTLKSVSKGDVDNKGKKFFEFLREFGTREIAGEQAATLLQSINDYAFGLDEQMEQAQTVEEMVNIQMDRQIVTAIATVVAGGVQAGGVQAINKGIEAVTQQASEQQQRYDNEQHNIDTLNKAATDSKTRQRDVETFRQFMQDASADGETHVYIDGQATRDYLAQLTPEEIANDPALAAMSEQVSEASTLAGDVVIPVADFATDFAGTDHFTALRQDMKMSSESVTPNQVEAQAQATEDFRVKLMQEAEKNVTEYAEAQNIATGLIDQLVDTGRMNAQDARTSTEIVSAFVAVKARQEGIGVQEAWDKYGFTVEGPLTGEKARLDAEEALLSQARESGYEGDNAVEASGVKIKRYDPAVEGDRDRVISQQNKLLFQKDTGKPTARGYYDPQNSIIRLTEASDLSTFIHEFAHFMYETELKSDSPMIESINSWYKRNAEEVAKEATETKDAQGRAVTEADVINFLDTGRTGSDPKDTAIRRAVHEQFARGFETYVMEGKAPSIELRNAFRRMARWLVEVYRSITLQKPKLDKEMREVFDRLLATDEQIEAAKARQQFSPMFTDAAMSGMTEKEFEAYQERKEKVTDKANETLRDKMIKEITRQTQKWWKEEKQDIIDEEINRLSDQPVYRAREVLKSGEIRLDHATVKDLYGEEKTDKRGRTSVRIPPALNRMTAKGMKGIHPDEAAAMLGYESGAELVNDLITAPPVKEVADTNAEAIMKERHGDMMNDGSIEQLADQAIQNEERGKLILSELKVLSRGTNQPAIERKAIQDLARENIGKLSFRKINPGKYRRAEIKAARESERMLEEGNREGAAAAKARQVMNYYLGMEAQKARDESMKILDRMKRYNKKSVREEIIKAENGYWEQIEKVLSRFEFRKSASLKAVDQVDESIQVWADRRINEDGAGLTLTPAVMNELYVTHWKNVPFAELVGINDSVRNMEHVARKSNEMKVRGEKIDFKKLVQQLVDHIGQVDAKFPTKKSRSRADDAAEVAKGRQWLSQLTKVPFLTSWLDGGERVGLVHDVLMQPFTDALDAKFKLVGQVARPIYELINNRSKDAIKRHAAKIHIPEINDTIMGHQVLSVALNTGNEGNLRKMLLGEGWANPEFEEEISINNPQLQAVLKHMTKEDWDMVQKIWDQMDMLYTPVTEVSKRDTGLIPGKVESVEIETPFGTYKGGYYPVKYSPKRSHRADENLERQEAEVDSMFSTATMVQASVNTGVINERTDYYAPIHMSLDVIPQHFDEVIHYITHHEAVRQTNKLLRNNEFEDAVTAVLGEEEFKQLKPWLNDIAKDGRSSKTKSYVEDAFQRLRFGVTLGVMGFSASTGLMQFFGLFTTAAEIGVMPTLKGIKDTIGASWYMKAIRRSLGSESDMQSTWDFAVERSKVLPHRMETMDREIRAAMQRLAGKRGIIAGAQEASMKHIALIQTYMVDLPTWMAAYDKKLSETGQEDKAVQFADWAIENLQGSGATKDMAAILRDQGKIHTTFTMFMTFFSSLGNLTRDVARGAKSRQYSNTDVAAKLMFLFTIPVFMEMLIHGEFEEPEDEDDRLQSYLTNLALYPVTAVPFARDVVSGVVNDYGYNVTPVASVLEKGIMGYKQIKERTFTDEEVTKGAWKGATKLTAAAIGVPGVGQVWKTGEHLNEVLTEGEEFTARELLFGPKRD